MITASKISLNFGLVEEISLYAPDSLFGEGDRVLWCRSTPTRISGKRTFVMAFLRKSAKIFLFKL